MFSRINLDKLQNKIDCNSVLDDGRIVEAVLNAIIAAKFYACVQRWFHRVSR